MVDILLGGISMPPIEPLLMFAYEKKIESRSAALSQWNALSLDDQTKYRTKSNEIRKVLYKNLSNIKPHKQFNLSNIKGKDIYFCHIYPILVSIYPDMSDDELQKYSQKQYSSLDKAVRDSYEEKVAQVKELNDGLSSDGFTSDSDSLNEED